MATSTLVQFLGDGITSPTDAAGDTSARRQVETYIAASAISKGEWVQFDNSQTGADRVLYVEQCAADALGGVTIGVALAAAGANEQVRVVIAGYVEDAVVTTGVAANDPLSVDTTAGRADTADATNAVICGVCLDTAASNKAPVYVYKRV